MPIEGRTAEDCFEQYRGHIGPLIAATLTKKHIVNLPRLQHKPNARPMYLGHDKLKAVALESSTHGRIHLQLSQDLEAVPSDDGKFQLKTRQYWYKVLCGDPKFTDEPLFRWEYVKNPDPGDRWCRHHFQVGKVMGGRDGEQPKAISVPLGDGQADLNRLHVPTGYVLIEYVIRFLITDFGIDPPCGLDQWEQELERSEATFFERFSPKPFRLSNPP